MKESYIEILYHVGWTSYRGQFHVPSSLLFVTRSGRIVGAEWAGVTECAYSAQMQAIQT
jgi:hypothetical protein